MGSKANGYEQRKDKLRRKKKIKRTIKLIFSYVLVAVFCITGIWLTVTLYDHFKDNNVLSSLPSLPSSSIDSTSNDSSFSPTADPSGVAALGIASVPEYIEVDIIPVENARPGEKLVAVNGIVIHYVGEPGASASEIRENFAKPEANVSSHFVIGLDGEVIQCLPLDEQAIASGERNADTISIEVCHTSTDGLFNAKSYNALTDLCAWLLKTANLSVNNCYRHYDMTGADCPPHYVTNTDDWETLKSDISNKMITD